MTQIVIQASPKALHHRIISSAIVTACICGGAALFFAFFKPLASHATLLVAATCAGVAVIWLFSMFAMTRKWHRTTYVLAEEYLAVNKGAVFGVGKRRLYRYETMVSISVSQRRNGKRHDYGTIRIAIAKPSRDMKITYVPDPERQAVFIRNQMGNQQNK